MSEGTSSSGIREAPKLRTLTVSDMIEYAAQNPPEPIIEGLFNVGDILLIHGTEDSFKSVLILQIAESLATAKPLLRRWRVPRARVVGVIETEMHQTSIGERLRKMYSACTKPDNLKFLGEAEMRKFRRRKSIPQKLQLIRDWIQQEGIEVLLIDTANDFFRSDNNPSAETVVGGFFDELRNLGKACALVRHDRKSKGDGLVSDCSNERIRGSAEWKEDPESILFLDRQDRRTHQVSFEVAKLRYGSKPEPMTLWLDAGCFRLSSLPPVIAVLETGPKSRQEIVAECQSRFVLGERKVDEMLKESKPFLCERQQGHEKVFEIDFERSQDAPWYRFVRVSEEAGS